MIACFLHISIAQTFLQLLGSSESLVESHAGSNHSHVVVIGLVHHLRGKEDEHLNIHFTFSDSSVIHYLIIPEGFE